MKFSEERVIQIVVNRVVASYQEAVPLQLPKGLSPEQTIKKICDLAQANNETELTEFMRSCDSRALQYIAVEVVGWSGNIVAIDLLVKKFRADKGHAELGYAWGGYVDKATNAYHGYHREGFALGGFVDKVNNSVLGITNGVELYSMAKGYRDGGHLENADEALELITETTNTRLKELIIDLLPTPNKFIKQKSQLIANLMQKQSINYQEALKLFTQMEQTSALSTFGLFKDVAYNQLSYYQIKALEKYQPKISILMLMSWKSKENELFSPQHVLVLGHLLEKLSAEATLDEIQGLNGHQATALLELYDKGLRGEHLRHWYEQNEGKRFCDKCLDKLLKLHFENGIEPVVALKQITGVTTDMHAVGRRMSLRT